MQLTLPNSRIFAQATLINQMLKAMGKAERRDRRPALLRQAAARAAAERPREHDHFAQGQQRSEALF
jgi:hypothetical protein